MDEYYTCTRDVGSVWHRRWPEFKYICQWPIFHGPVILPYILKIICWTNAIIGLLVPCDVSIYLIKCMWVSDLHFIVQWLCLIAWRLLDGLMLYWRYWFSVTQTLNWNYICRSVTYISWSSGFVLYFEEYLMDKCPNWNTGSMWCKDLPDTCMWVSDLHFMVQWFCLIFWGLFDGLILYWRYFFNKTQILTWNYLYRPVTYISWSSDFAIYLDDYMMDKILCHSWNPCDAKINHIQCMWVISDLHFVVQWFWHIDLEDILMEECWTEDTHSVWH